MNNRPNPTLFSHWLRLSLALLALNGCAWHLGPSSAAKAGLPALIVQRLGWMDQVAQAKQARSLPVNDPKREAELLKAMEKLGAEAGLPGASVRHFFTGQMRAAKVRQGEWLKAHPPASQQGKPTPDLAKTIRPALDQIGRLMMARLAEARGSKETAKIVSEARHRLMEAGYSEAVIAPAIKGLEAGLR